MITTSVTREFSHGTGPPAATARKPARHNPPRRQPGRAGAGGYARRVPRLLLAAVAFAGVIVSVAMVVLGLPEANAVQSVLLELSALPLSVSVAAGIAMLHLSAARPLGPRGRVAMLTGAAFVLLGAALIVWAYLVGPRAAVHPGQVLIWIGLFAALLVTVRRQPKRRLVTYELRDDPEATATADEDASL